MKQTNKKKGFTIVELVIVIAVIGILSAVLIPTFSGLVNKAKETALQEGLANAYTAYAADEHTDGSTLKAKDEIYFSDTEDHTTTVYKFDATSGKYVEYTVETGKTLELVKLQPAETEGAEKTAKQYNGYYAFIVK